MRAMKNSGIVWIGEIPDGWGISKVSRFYSVILGKMLSPVKEATDSTLENYLCAQNIKWDGINTSEIKQMWFSCYEKEKYLLENQDVIVTEGGDIGVSSVYNGEFFPCYIQNAVHKVTSRSGNKSENKLFYYWMHLVKNSGYLDLICNKATIAHFTKEKLSSTPMIVIPSKQQHHIASFLDTKSSQINSTIQKEREVIHKLKEYRQAVITEAVTKGIRAGVPMKDSGVEWIGEIPINWKITSLKNIVDIRDGTHDTPRYIDEGNDTYPLISSKDFVNSKIDYSECKWISFEDYKSICMRSKVESGDVLMSMIGGNIGKSIIVKENPHFAIKNVALFKTGLNKSLATLLHLYFSTTLLKTQIDLKSRGGAQDFLGLTDIRNLVWVFMGESEQQEIASYLDKKCSDIDATIQKRELAIEKLTAYKQSLIYECVTGKREAAG